MAIVIPIGIIIVVIFEERRNPLRFLRPKRKGYDNILWKVFLAALSQDRAHCQPGKDIDPWAKI
jgi:hypothetical protein